MQLTPLPSGLLSLWAASDFRVILDAMAEPANKILDNKKIVILGAGAVGAALAKQLCASQGNQLYFGAKGERLKRLEQDPLRVNHTRLEIPVLNLDRPSVPVDLLILTVKAPQLTEALQDAEPLVGPRTIILSLLNGIESEEQIAALYGWERTLYGYVVGIDATRSGNQVRNTALGTFVFGEANNQTISEKVDAVHQMFSRAGVACEIPTDMVRSLWWKFMINVGMNPTSAVLRAPYRIFQDYGEARDLMDDSMAEVLAVASAEGIGLDAEDASNWHAILETLDPSGKTSMLQDVEAGRRTEVDIFSGSVSRLGKAQGIATPLNDLLLRIIRGIECEFE